MKRKRTIIIIVVAVVVVAAAAFIVRTRRAGGGDTFKLAEVTKGDIENTISATGTLSPVGAVDVGAQVSGKIEKIYVDFNDAVTSGEVLAVLDTTLFAAQVLESETQVTQSRAKLKQTELEYKQDKPLFEQGFLSETEFVTTETSLEESRAQLASAEAALVRARTNLRYSTIRSPIDGTVIERNVEEGQTIAASFQTPTLFVIARGLAKMQIEVYVDESDIGLIKEGQSVRFTVQAYPDDTFTGTVRQVRLMPTTIQNVVNYTVIVDAANDQGLLLPGMTATVDFVVEEKHDVLVVPNSALQFTPSQQLIDQMSSQMSEHPSRGSAGARPPSAGAPGGGAGAGAALPADAARVFYLDEKGAVRAARFRKGSTDGSVTEILDGGELREGMRVIIGLDGGAQKEAKRSILPFGPPRGGGRPPM